MRGDFLTTFIDSQTQSRTGAQNVNRGLLRYAIDSVKGDKSMNPMDLMVEFAAGTRLVEEGAVAEVLYLIDSGRVAIISQQAPNLLLAELGEGDVVGEAALLKSQTYPTDAIARTHVRCLAISRSELAALVAERPEIGLSLAMRIAERLNVSERSRVGLALSERGQAPMPVSTTSPLPHDTTRRSLAVKAQIRQASEAFNTDPNQQHDLSATTQHMQGIATPQTHQTPSSHGGDACGQDFILRHSGGDLHIRAGRNDYLVGRRDPMTGRVPEIDLGNIDVGRSLSRRHARIFVTDEGMQIMEVAGAMNGTFVNGKRLKPDTAVALNEGDLIRFGAVEVSFYLAATA